MEIPRDRFWGKLERDDEGGLIGWHPLEAHSADVAAVFEALLEVESLRSRLEAAAGAHLSSGQVQRLAILAALHDLGKYNHGFQKRSDKGASNPCGHVKPLSGLLDRRHFSKTSVIFGAIRSWFRSDEDLLCYLHASVSHHGSPSTPFNLQRNYKLAESHWWRDDSRRNPFQGIEALLDDCRSWFPAAFKEGISPLPGSSQFTHLFAGLVSLADWLGSDTRWFPYCGDKGRPGPDCDPMPFARQSAKRALGEMGLRVDPIVRMEGRPPSFTQQFGLHEPRPLQKVIMELPLNPEGGLVIVEGETGSGKTEAAWIYFTRLFCAGLVDGLYFANPLRLAATQIHKRLVSYAANTFGPLAPSVVLAVPGYIKADDYEGKALPGYKVLWPDLDEPELGTRFWAAESPKRFLCAPIGVGTVDQALMAGLRLPHAALRAGALCRSLLVVDEVHASDAYMNKLMMNLIDLFQRCGGQVLLMSATLGAETRAEFLSCWQGSRLLDKDRPFFEDARAVDYPLVTRSGEGCLSPEENGLPAMEKQVAIRLHPYLTCPDEAAGIAADLARQGAVVVVLRNTVRRAVETFLCLENRLADSPELLFSVDGVATLHHGRFASADRHLLDQRLIAMYGKQKGPCAQRPAMVVVGTQTLEQSLDIDFDVLISDLCPMDVLLQRIGRLHRHDGIAREPRFKKAVCHVLVPEQGEQWLRSRSANSHGFGLTAQGETMAYADPRALVAAWRLLARHEGGDVLLRIPAMNRELVEGGLHSRVLNDIAIELGGDWQEDERRLHGLLAHHRQLAAVHSIDWGQAYGPDSAAVMDNEKISTRLGLRDMLVELSEKVPGPFMQDVGAIKIPGWMVRGEIEPTVEDLIGLPGGGFDFRLGGSGIYYTYNRLGLHIRGDYDQVQFVGRALL